MIAAEHGGCWIGLMEHRNKQAIETSPRVTRFAPVEFSFGLIACLLAGLPIGLDVVFIGRLTGTEVAFVVVVAVALVARALPPLTWPIRQLLLLAVVWFLAQLLSDLLQDTLPENMARGGGRSLVTIILVVGYFSIVADKITNIIASFISISFGLLIGYLIEPNEYAIDDPWKFGYGYSVTMFLIVAARFFWTLRPHGIAIAVTVCVAASGLNFIMGFRSVAVTSFMTALLIGLSPFGGLARRVPNVVLAFAAVVLVAGVGGLTAAYSGWAQSGVLGDVEQEKYWNQVGSQGVLLSGRAEILVSSQAIMERPWLGFGSWAANDRYSDLFKDIVGAANFSVLDDDLIPSHSHLFGAWVEGGVFAALFWIYALVLVGRAFVAMVRHAFFDPVVVFVLVNVVWAILFSPYGLQNRAMSCFAIVVAATVLRLAKRA